MCQVIWYIGLRTVLFPLPNIGNVLFLRTVSPGCSEYIHRAFGQSEPQERSSQTVNQQFDLVMVRVLPPPVTGWTADYCLGNGHKRLIIPSAASVPWLCWPVWCYQEACGRVLFDLASIDWWGRVGEMHKSTSFPNVAGIPPPPLPMALYSCNMLR